MAPLDLHEVQKARAFSWPRSALSTRSRSLAAAGATPDGRAAAYDWTGWRLPPWFLRSCNRFLLAPAHARARFSPPPPAPCPLCRWSMLGSCSSKLAMPQSRSAPAPMRLAGLIAAAAGYSQSELETTGGTRHACRSLSWALT